MPNKDMTGPRGQGPMTGMGGGICGCGLGRGRWWGKGRGFGRYYNTNTQQTDPTQKDVKDYIQTLEEELEEVKKLLQ